MLRRHDREGTTQKNSFRSAPVGARLIIYAEDNHGLLFNRLEREKRIIDWFTRYMRTSH